MFNRRSPFVEDYPRRIALGDGQGRFQFYTPYLRIQDVPSQAIRSRVYIPRFGRFIHVLSHSELSALLLLEWDDTVIEVREQFPLDPTTTLSICLQEDIRPPMWCGRRTVMTSDFVVTYQTDFLCSFKSYQVKATSEESVQPRTAEKLKVEQEYWRRQGIEWNLLVASDFNRRLVGNLETLRQLRAMPFSRQALCEAENFFAAVQQELHPQFPIQKMAQVKLELGDRTLNGFQIATLLIAKKIRTAPIDRLPLGSIAIGQVKANGDSPC